MRRPRSRFAIVVILVLGALIFGGVLYLWNTATDVFQPVSNSKQAIPLEVRPGESTADIADELQRKGLIRNAVAFRVWARVRGLDKQLQAGVYRQLSPNKSIQDIIDSLLSGQPDEIPVVIVEGYRLEQVANAFSNVSQKLEHFDRGEFLKYTKDVNQFPDKDKYPLLQQVPQDHPDMEGLLFPATYEIPIESNARDIVNILLKQMVKAIDDNKLEALAKQHQYQNVYQMITLASIIERETGSDQFRQKIGSVYWNRTFKPGNETVGFLQADPTVQYAQDTQNPPTPPKRYWTPVGDPNNTQPDSPWNTYTQKGLPPTPICSPGLASLAAAAEPLNTDYYYFFAAKDGITYFAKTNAEFNALQQQHPVNN